MYVIILNFTIESPNIIFISSMTVLFQEPYSNINVGQTVDLGISQTTYMIAIEESDRIAGTY